eukprot:GHVN01056608.1.p1 GENE.GHVN01056608.1~~GHVN01056608.1.p1  ORF type:complete len:487 (+),score=46.30 GHVN01056608.1:2476-3936(+)
MPLLPRYLYSYLNKPAQHKILVWNSYGGQPAWKDPGKDVKSKGVKQMIQYVEVFPNRLSVIAEFLEGLIQFDLKHHKEKHVICGAVTLRQLMEACQVHNLDPSALYSNVISTINLLLVDKKGHLKNSPPVRGQGNELLRSVLTFPRVSLPPRFEVLVPILAHQLEQLSGEEITSMKVIGVPAFSAACLLLAHNPEYHESLRQPLVDCIIHVTQEIILVTESQLRKSSAPDPSSPKGPPRGSSTNPSADSTNPSGSGITPYPAQVSIAELEPLYHAILESVATLSRLFKGDEVWEVLEPLTGAMESVNWQPATVTGDMLRTVARGQDEMGYIVFARVLQWLEATKVANARLSLIHALRAVLREAPTFEIWLAACVPVWADKLATQCHRMSECGSSSTPNLYMNEIREGLLSVLTLYCKQIRYPHNIIRVQAIVYCVCQQCFEDWVAYVETTELKTEFSTLFLRLSSTIKQHSVPKIILEHGFTITDE